MRCPAMSSSPDADHADVIDPRPLAANADAEDVEEAPVARRPRRPARCARCSARRVPWRMLGEALFGMLIVAQVAALYMFFATDNFPSPYLVVAPVALMMLMFGGGAMFWWIRRCRRHRDREGFDRVRCMRLTLIGIVPAVLAVAAMVVLILCVSGAVPREAGAWLILLAALAATDRLLFVCLFARLYPPVASGVHGA